MAYRNIATEKEAKQLIEDMTDHTYDARSVGLWFAEKISELEERVSKLERRREIPKR